MITKHLVALILLIGVGSCLGGCSPFAGFVADHWPHWAGGMPEGVPPRPGSPGYNEFVAHGQAGKEADKPADPAAEKANAQAVPAADQPRGDKDADQSGLY